MKQAPFPRLLPVLAALFVGSVFVRASITSSDWVPVARVDILDEEGVVYSDELHAFVVQTDEGPLALSDKSPHLGDTIIYCESSGLFEAVGHGEKFDREGNYYAGPAPRGMDTYEAKVQGAAVLVNPNRVIPGPERGSSVTADPHGPFCSNIERTDRGIVES